VDQTDQTDTIWYPTDTRHDTSPICHIRCTFAHTNSHIFQQWFPVISLHWCLWSGPLCMMHLFCGNFLTNLIKGLSAPVSNSSACWTHFSFCMPAQSKKQRPSMDETKILCANEIDTLSKCSHVKSGVSVCFNLFS